LMKGHVMSEKGLAERESREVVVGQGVAEVAGRTDKVWLGRGSGHSGCGDAYRQGARPMIEASPLPFLR